MSTIDTSQGTSGTASIDPATTLGPVTLAVADAGRSLRFYRDLLGFQVLAEDSARITLGAGGVPLLELHVQRGLRPKPRATTGLYHVAILLPSRLALARVLRRLLEANYPIGASDHEVSEALYLSDPDDNGLEIYRDRPRETWRHRPDGQLVMGTIRLDIDGILGELRADDRAWNGMPEGTRIGHMHLQVDDIATAEAFYGGVLGFDMIVRLPGALFLSAGGYHHHIGLNTWESAGAPRQPAGTAGLRTFTIVLPDAVALAQVQARITAAGMPFSEQDGMLMVKDPWGHTLELRVEN